MKYKLNVSNPREEREKKESKVCSNGVIEVIKILSFYEVIEVQVQGRNFLWHDFFFFLIYFKV